MKMNLIPCLSDEMWVDIPGYEGIYQASNLGRIRTTEGKMTYTKWHGERRWKQRVLKQKRDRQANHRVTLWKGGKPKDYLVARLICSAFHGNYLQNRALTVNHMDGNRDNNSSDNLEWLSLADNIRHGFMTGLYHTMKPVLLVGVHEKRIMPSMAACDRYLGRTAGYTSNRIKKSAFVISARGDVFKVLRYE